jgi:hypothetical protein
MSDGAYEPSISFMDDLDGPDSFMSPRMVLGEESDGVLFFSDGDELAIIPEAIREFITIQWEPVRPRSSRHRPPPDGHNDGQPPPDGAKDEEPPRDIAREEDPPPDGANDKEPPPDIAADEEPPPDIAKEDEPPRDIARSR